MCFSLDKFKNTSTIEKTISGWFCHEDARSKREEISGLIRQASEVARAAGLVKGGLPKANQDSKLHQEPEKKIISLEDMKVTDLQAALKARGLKRSGKKSELVSRLRSSLEAEAEPDTSTQCPRKRKLMLDNSPNKRRK